jgi:uncharacterized protein YqjF (DUF2071 family)
MQKPADILRARDHRPWELPHRPWIMIQSWRNLLFAHWPIPSRDLRQLVPNSLEIELFDGEAWLAVTPFYLVMKPRAVGIRHEFPEMNCRTYVTYKGKPGIFFFSLDAGSRLAVWGARTFYYLPYFYSRMEAKKDGDTVVYRSQRLSSNARFAGMYAPRSPVRTSNVGTLENWLTERYCLYTVRGGRVFRGEIHHKPWPLQDATAEIADNTVAAAAGIQLPETAPLLHFVYELDVLIWALQRA